MIQVSYLLCCFVGVSRLMDLLSDSREIIRNEVQYDPNSLGSLGPPECLCDKLVEDLVREENSYR